MAYDKTDWHSGGDYPEDLPPENGGTHIGMFLAWIIKSHLEGVFHKEAVEALEKVRNESMTGREYFSMYCDEKLWEDDLNEEANAFAKFYYLDGTYFEDYESILLNNLPTLYHIENTWENYHKLESRLTERFNEWRVNHPFTPSTDDSTGHSDHESETKKTWWKFW